MKKVILGLTLFLAATSVSAATFKACTVHGQDTNYSNARYWITGLNYHKDSSGQIVEQKIIIYDTHWVINSRSLVDAAFSNLKLDGVCPKENNDDNENNECPRWRGGR